IGIRLKTHGSGDFFTMGFIKNLFAGLFGFLGSFFKKSDKASKAAPKAKTAAAPATQAAPATTQAAPAAAQAMNLPQPKVTTSAPAPVNYSAFGPRRRPGANMKSYLDMAKTVKNA
ncbi:MAG: hypothetical protein WCD18_10120, partial [Thermosynechococcaceae cyanobacterium]